MSPEGGADQGLERMVMRELRDLLVSLCSAQPVRFGSVVSPINTRVNSQVNAHSIRVLVVLVTLAGVLAVMSQGASEYFFKENNSLRKFCCCAELEPGVGPACPVSGCCSVLTGYSN